MPLIEEEIDGLSGLLFPFYDADTHMLYLAGKVVGGGGGTGQPVGDPCPQWAPAPALPPKKSQPNLWPSSHPPRVSPSSVKTCPQIGRSFH